MSYWTKRRKLHASVAKQVAELFCASSLNCDDNFVDLTFPPCLGVTGANCNTDPNHGSTSRDNTLDADLDPFSLCVGKPTEDFEDEPELFYSDTEDEDLHAGNDLATELAEWGTRHAVTMNSLSDLLDILRKRFSNLPKDPRTLFKTATKSEIDLRMRVISSGAYYHFGLANGVEQQLSNKDYHVPHHIKFISIQINIDGVPLFKSSGGQFWPILGKIDAPFVSEPFVIGIFMALASQAVWSFLMILLMNVVN